MSRADDIFIQNCRQILEHGYSTENEKVRPHWEDGTPAYTIKTFGEVNRYALSKDFPLLTLSPTIVKAERDETSWIWRTKSAHLNALNRNF